MKCLLFNCYKEAKYPYPACSINHGLKIKEIKKDLKSYQNEVGLDNWYFGFGPGHQSLEELNYYNNLISYEKN